MSFPNILRRTISQNILRESYEGLLGFGVMIEVNFLK